jgi:uncharacterized membrane protein
MPLPGEEVAGAIRRNIETVVRLEESFSSERSAVDCLVDRIVSFLGSTKFVVLHVIVITAWLTVNGARVPGVPKFDPFPFLLLSVLISIEALFLATFVLLKQNRMSRQQDLRAHLDLQINLLAEREMTLVLQMLQQISTGMGIHESREEIQELLEETSVEAVATKLREKLPGE